MSDLSSGAAAAAGESRKGSGVVAAPIGGKDLATIGKQHGTEMPPLVDGTKDNSVAAQRRLRGILLIINLFGMVANVLLVFLVVSAVTGRQIRYVPQTESVIDPEARMVTDGQVGTMSKILVNELETWTDATVSTTFKRVAPWIDATFHDELGRYYSQLTDQVRGSAQSRYCVAFAARINRRTESFIEVLVPYELVVLSGLITLGKTRQIMTEARRMAVLRFVRRAPTDENPFGLFLKQIDHIDREDWLSAGNEDIWTIYTTSRN